MPRRRSARIPAGSKGVYHLDVASSPKQFEEGEGIVVTNREPPAGHCYAINEEGKEKLIRTAEIDLAPGDVLKG